MRTALILASTTMLCILAKPAHAQHDVHAFLSESGVAFIENNASSFLPSVLEPQPYTKAVGCMDFEQRDTIVNLSLDRLDIQLPANDRVRVELDLTIDAQGELYVDDLYACLGEVTCQDTMSLQSASAVVDLTVEIVDGVPKATVRDVTLDLDPANFDFALSDCGVTGSSLTSVIDFAEGWLLYFAEVQLASIAEENLAPMIESLLAGMSTDGSYVAASVESLSFPNNGMSVVAQGGLKEKYEAAECIREFDEGGPEPETGAQVPNLAVDGSSDLNVAVNLGLLNQGFYAVWHRGLLCLSDGHLAELGVELDLAQYAAMLPGFPAGSTLGLEFRFTKPPRVQSAESEDAELTLVVEGFELQLHADTPNGDRNTLRAELDFEASTRLAVDPVSNAIHVQLIGAQITRMKLRDERDATEEGYDVARIQQLLHEAVLPVLLKELGSTPVSGSVFAVANVAVLLRSVASNSAYLSAGLDLFRIPDVDLNAPDTQILDAPTTVANPQSARILLGGSDSEIPEELLQYQVVVDGIAHPLSFVREAHIGVRGVTASYEVQVAAVDLAGNVDPSPATRSLLVDGIMPVVIVSGARTRSADEGPVEIRWNMSDDRTEAAALKVRVEIFDLEDPSDVLSARLIDSRELAPGMTSTIVELDKVGGVYRVEVHATDEAGNDSKSTLLLGVASAGGCSIGGQGPSSMSLLLLALGALSLRRRRKRQA